MNLSVLIVANFLVKFLLTHVLVRETLVGIISGQKNFFSTTAPDMYVSMSTDSQLRFLCCQFLL